MKSATEMVVHSAGCHFPQRDQIHFQGMFPGFAFRIPPVSPSQKIERDWARKFRRRAEAAFFVVKTPRKLFVSDLKNLMVDLGSGFRLSALRFAKRFHNLRSLLGDFFVVLLPSRRNPFQYLRETRLTESILRRKISPSDKRFQIGREPDAHRPATAARRRLHKRHVNAI